MHAVHAEGRAWVCPGTGRVVAQFPRDRVFISTKWGPMFKPDGQMTMDFSPEACRAACEGSLKRLGVGCIDLWVMRGPCRGEGALEAAVRTMKVLFRVPVALLW